MDFAIIKRMKENGNIGWGTLLIPFCKDYFDNNLPLDFIKNELLELHQFEVSIYTLQDIRTKYRKDLAEKNLENNASKSPEKETIETFKLDEEKKLIENGIKHTLSFLQKLSKRLLEVFVDSSMSIKTTDSSLAYKFAKNHVNKLFPHPPLDCKIK
jgi:glutamyl-tRNA reductase